MVFGTEADELTLHNRSLVVRIPARETTVSQGKESQVAEALFDLSAEYDAMLNKGLRLSGENKEFFARGRIEHLARTLPADFNAARILDFGCGIGDTTALLAETFPKAGVVGIDNAASAIESARQRHSSSRLSFQHLDEFAADYSYDLCYVNGVFHHIEPRNRPEALGLVHRALRPGGRLALFENNPWNPGTRLAMKQIPFDRDAQPLSPTSARRLLEGNGFDSAPSDYLFFFPRVLKALRPLEPHLLHFPMGAQYLVLATKSAA